MPKEKFSLQCPRSALVVLIAAVTAAGAFSACSSKTEVAASSPGALSNVTLSSAQRRNIQLFTVTPGKFRREIDTNGTVSFDNEQSTSVVAPFSGPVTRLLVSLGDHVKAGEPLAAVASADFSTAVSAYRKALTTAETDRWLADLDKDLVEHKGVAQREAEQAQTDALSAEADRDAAQKALESLGATPQVLKDIRAGRAVSRTEATIRSPITGSVVEKLISPGELLQAGTTACFTVADLSRVWVLAQVFGPDIASVSLGDEAEISTGTGPATYTGTVDNVAALVNPDTRAVTVRVVVKDPGALLKSQMYVHVLLRARAESTAVLVPVSAILRDDENLPFVYAAQSDGSFARQRVTLGYRAGKQYEIATGVQAGDQIVVDGGIFVQFVQNQ